MSPSLLATKLYIPPARPNAISRPRLTEKLTTGLAQTGSFALISGPAGFGKTTLLSEWIAGQQQPAAWLSLDEGDNDPIRFWSYLIAACQSIQEGFGESILALFRSSQPLQDQEVAAILINELVELDPEFILILDDYHTIQNETIHTAMLFLVEHLPEKLHPVISTRVDPPWPLARFRARNQLVEIRAQDLRFTGAEAASFLNRMMALNLTPEDVAALDERTEGWAAGLQLAALSMKGRADISGFVKAFTGSHVFIAEYLVEEVLKRQPKDVEEFLLQTSILDRLEAGLCEAVTGCESGQSMLTALYRANLFVVSLDDEGRWYRYHHLFTDLLRARLQRSLSKTAMGELHRRAAGWYEQAGMIPEAIEHALAAQDYPQVLRLVETIALPMILQAHVRTVEHWLQVLPRDLIEKSPRLNMAFAWMNLLRGAFAQAVPYLEQLKAIFSSPAGEKLAPALQGEWLAIQCELLIAQGKPEEGRDLANQALKILPEVDAGVRSMIYITLAKAFQQTYDYDRAAEVFQMIVRDAQRMGDFTFEILGLSGQVQMYLKQGRLRLGFQVASEGIRRVEMSEKKIPFSATLYGEIGEIHYQWHHLDQARMNLLRSMQASGKSGYSDPEIYHSIMLSKIAQMEGNLDGAVREMQKAGHLAGLIPPAMIRENVISQQVWVDLAVDQPAAAEQMLAAEGFTFGETFRFPDLDPGSKISYAAGLLYNSALRVLLYNAKKKQDRVNLKRGIELAERVFDSELRCQHNPLALETLLLLSQMAAVLGDPHQSRIELVKALRMAEPEGFISVFVEEGRPIADALNALLQSDLGGEVRPEYIREILAAFPNPPSPQKQAAPRLSGQPRSTAPAPAESADLVESLTARELEVLRLIAAGDSNQAVAEKLVITVSAVKKHTANIYGKLNVNSRTQAVARARHLGLLPVLE